MSLFNFVFKVTDNFSHKIPNKAEWEEAVRRANENRCVIHGKTYVCETVEFEEIKQEQ